MDKSITTIASQSLTCHHTIKYLYTFFHTEQSIPDDARNVTRKKADQALCCSATSNMIA